MASYSHAQPGWHPPAPSLVSLPVDTTKTEPKPAFYKLQFGDDVTGFNYYVRTTTVVIGRNCVSEYRYKRRRSTDVKDMKGVPLPPPDERHLGGPTKPPLELELGLGFEEDMKPELPFGLDEPLSVENLDIGGDGNGMDVPMANGDVVQGEGRDTAARHATPAAAAEDAVMDEVPQAGPMEAVTTEVPQAGPMENVTTEAPIAPTVPTLVRTTSEDQVEVKVEQPEPPIADSHTASSAPPETSDHPLISPQIRLRPLSAPPTSDADKVDLTIFDHLDPDALEALVLAATSDSPPLVSAPPPPPPPIKRASDTLEHVDVDLGPLKSVSRNHAKISYFADLGHFCLEILGRNGAWVDDRYFVRGSTVPLNQG
jgi:hypothetical protein